MHGTWALLCSAGHAEFDPTKFDLLSAPVNISANLFQKELFRF